MAALIALRKLKLDVEESKAIAAATRVAAIWKGKLARKYVVERRVPTIALIASVEVGKRRRRGLVQFIAYVSYMAFLAFCVLVLADQRTAFSMERKNADLIDGNEAVLPRESVLDVETMW